MFRAVFFILVLCLSGCGNFNQPIEAFIDDQTGMVKLQEITPEIPEAVVREDGSIRIPPAAAGAPEFTLELSLRNEPGYALDFAVLNNDGTETDPDHIWAESGGPGRIFIHIAGVQPGDEFNLTLKLWKADGRRTFDDIVIPPIIFEPFPLSDAKAITGFILEGKSGTIDEAGRTIAVTLLPGTGVTGLAPVIIYTGASIDPGTGVARDFSAPQTYTVTAADGSTRSYTVTVTVTAAPVYSITIMPHTSGTVTASVPGAPAGETVTLTFTPDSGYILIGAAYAYGGTSVPLMPGAQTITMPAAGITVTAVFTPIGSYVARRGTTPYTSLKAAIDAAPTGSAGSPDTIILLKNISLPEAPLAPGYSITKHIRLISSGMNTITRERSFISGSLFTVGSGASLTLEGSPNALVVDGNYAASVPVSANAALITVDGGTLNMRDGVVLRNNRNTATNGGGVCVIDGGSFTLSGTAEITGNNTANNGGGVYVSGTGSRFDMRGGTIGGSGTAKNTAANGGGVLVSNGASFTMTGGSVTGNAAATGSGGGVCMIGSNSRFEMQGGTIGGSGTAKNTAVNGGGVSISNGSFTMTGGSITGNGVTAHGGGVYVNGSDSLFDMRGGTIGGNDPGAANTAANGNGVYVGNNGTFDMSGGSLHSNGVHVLGKITMKGGARVIDDWIYLTTSTFITLTGDLTGETPVAAIYPQNTVAGTKVLDGAPPLISNNKDKFNVDIAGSNSPPPYPGSLINDNGKLPYRLN
ncbi:MAG: hypothetical protein LBB68_00325 [Treponema sp.]|jgi:hypothetical protein|nr:hypothetical protein [Treponema sp.]